MLEDEDSLKQLPREDNGVRTVFGLFPSYEDARAAGDELRRKGFAEREMNAIAQSDVVKTSLKVNLSQINIAKSEDNSHSLTDEFAFGLDRLLGGEHIVGLLDAGPVYAGGQLATLLAKTAALPGATDGGLQGALMDFDVPADVARSYVNGIKDGGVLFFVRTDDERAPEAAAVLRANKATNVGSYGP